MHRSQPTARQLEILDFVAECINVRGYAPTHRELCNRFVMASTNAAADHMSRLITKGLLDRDKRKSRAVRITPAGRAALGYAPAPDGARVIHRSTAPVVTLRYGWRCGRCNAHTFDLDKPCVGCRLARQLRKAG